MSDNTADQARQGLGASVAGKLKEVTGAVLGNDSLAAEGQLQQAEAAARKDASLKEAVGHAEAAEAATEISREQQLAAREQQAAVAAADAKVEQVLDDADQQATATILAMEDRLLTEEARVDIDTARGLEASAQATQQELSNADQLERDAFARAVDERASAEAAEAAAARARRDAEALAGAQPEGTNR